MTLGRWPGRPPRATPGPTTIPMPSSCYGRIAGLTTSFPPLRVPAVPVIHGTPPCSAPDPSAAPIPRTTTPFNPTSATEGRFPALAGPGEEGGQPGGDRAGGRGLPPQRRDQGGVGGVAHVGALDEHLGNGGQVDASQVVAGLDTVGSVVAAEGLPGPAGERGPQVGAEADGGA